MCRSHTHAANGFLGYLSLWNLSRKSSLLLSAWIVLLGIWTKQISYLDSSACKEQEASLQKGLKSSDSIGAKRCWILARVVKFYQLRYRVMSIMPRHVYHAPQRCACSTSATQPKIKPKSTSPSSPSIQFLLL